MNRTGRCGQDWACESVDDVSMASAAMTAAGRIELSFDMRLSPEDASVAKYRKLVWAVNANALNDAILHVVPIPNAWSNISDHRR